MLIKYQLLKKSNIEKFENKRGSKMKKLITIFLFITVDLYCQDYLNVKHCTYPTYRYALVNDITEITFNSEETEMIINLQGMSPESEDITNVSPQ